MENSLEHHIKYYIITSYCKNYLDTKKSLQMVHYFINFLIRKLGKGSSQVRLLCSSIICQPPLADFGRIWSKSTCYKTQFFQIKQNDFQNLSKSSQSLPVYRGRSKNTAKKWSDLRWTHPLDSSRKW